MKDQDKILRFLEGELSDKEKSEVFASVTDKSLFTDEIRKHEVIQESIARNSSKIKASDNLKNAVLSQTVQKSKTGAFNKIAKYAGAFLLTSFIILLFVLNGIENKNTNATKNLSSSGLETEDKSELPVVNNFAVENTEDNGINKDIAEKRIINKTISKKLAAANHNDPSIRILSIASNRSDSKKNTLINNHKEDNPNPILKINESNYYIPERMNNVKTTHISNQLQTNDYEPLLGLPVRSRFSIEFFRNNDFHLPQATIDPAENLALNNTMFAISYKINDNFNIIADYRRENFFQIYSGIDATDGLLKEYRQQPNFQTIGAYLRFNIDIAQKMDYFVQGGLSVSTPGVIPRLRTGITYDIYQGFGIVLSSEYSHLFFSHQNQIFDTKKIGFHYGISYNF
jgi:hypothetical protein